MKNNEYNIVNITNEKNNFSGEYTNAQKVEYSFQPENKNPIKDELNDNSTINDKVEDNLLKSTKEKEKKKEKQESKALESNTSSSSAATSSASTANTAVAASSTGSAGALGGIVAAATISVAAIGTIVGVNVMGPAPISELARFLSSEVSTNSIDYSFSMPSQLLRYEEEQEGDKPLGEKVVVATIDDGFGFKEEEYLFEYEEYDENTLIFYHSFSRLSPDTGYALTLKIREDYPEQQLPIEKQLARRTFRTQASGEVFKFESVEASQDSVSFSFIVSNSAINYDPESGSKHAVKATIDDGIDYYDEMWIEGFEEYDNSSVIGYGDFSRLKNNTTYNLTIYVSFEQELKYLGSITFTTEEIDIGFNFLTNEFEATYSSIKFVFEINESQVVIDETAPAPTSNVYAQIYLNESLVDTLNVANFVESNASGKLKGSGTFTNLTDNTSYTIKIYLNEETNVLGSTSFSTEEIDIGFEFLTNEFEASYNLIKAVFDINQEQVIIDDTTEPITSNVYACIYLDESLLKTVNVVNFVESNASGKYKADVTFTGLTQSTSYSISVYLNEETNVLGSTTFSTEEFVQKITFNPLDVSSDSVSFSFEANLSDLGYNPDAPAMPNVFATIVDNDQFSDRLTLSNYQMIDDKRVTIFGDFSGLSPETAYTIDVYLESESNLLGSASFTTLEKTVSIEFEDVNSGRNYVDFTFTVSKEDIAYDPTKQLPAALKYEVMSTDEAYHDDASASSFEEVDDNTVRCSGSFTSLTPNLTYNLVVSLSTETGLVEIGKTTFDTLHEFKFQKNPSADMSDTSTNITISMRASYIGYISDEETPDVINHLSISVVEKDGGTPTTYSFAALSTYGEYVVAPSGDIGNLTPNTAYVLSVYYLPDNESPELLDSADFTTQESPYGFELINATPGETYCDFQFNLNSSELQQNNISINIFYNKIQLTSITVTDWTQTSEDIMTASARVENLPSSAAYSAEFYNNSTRTTYATKSFTTTVATGQYDFTIENQTIGKEDFSLDFSVNASAFNIDWTDGTAVDALQDQLLFEYYSADTTYQPEHAVGLMKSGDRASANFSITGLASDVEYVGVISYNDGTNNYPLGIVNFKTIPGVSNVNSNFAVVQDGSGNYRMPIDISFTGDSSYFGNNFIISFTPVGATSSFNATASVKEGYQYAIFDDETVSNYFDSTLNYNVYCSNDLTSSLYEGTASLTDASTGRSNTIFTITDMTDELSSSNTNFSFSMICSLANKQLSTTLVFVSGDDRYEYNIDLSNYDYSSPLSVDLLTTSSSTMTYEELKYKFNYVTFSIEIVYYTNASTGQTTTCEITDSFTFNFID